MKPEIITGLPSGVKEKGQRVDFRTEQFDLAIQTKGYRMWWSRAAVCPCRNNEQTDQPDIACSICKGSGRWHFLPELGLSTGDKDSNGNTVEVNEDGDALLILAICTSATQDPQIFEKFGEWTFGTIKVTTQPGNKLGYRDRLVMLDAEMSWAQLIEFDGADTIDVTGGYQRNGLRYKCINPIQLRSVARVFKNGADYQVNADGGLDWFANKPATGTMLSLNYTINPVFEVFDHVYAFRNTLVAKKKLTASKAEQHTTMPVHAMAKLDYLVEGA